MSSFDLAPAAQHWVNLLLVWIGFGAASGLAARVLLPLRQPTGPAGTICLGIIGSAAGLLALSLAIEGQPSHPFGPLGFAAAITGSLVVLLAYQAWCAGASRRAAGEEPDEDAGP